MGELARIDLRKPIDIPYCQLIVKGRKEEQIEVAGMNLVQGWLSLKLGTVAGKIVCSS